MQPGASRPATSTTRCASSPMTISPRAAACSSSTRASSCRTMHSSCSAPIPVMTAAVPVRPEEYGKIMVVTGGAEPKTYELGNKYLFQAITSADHYLTGAVDALHTLDPKAQIALVY